VPAIGTTQAVGAVSGRTEALPSVMGEDFEDDGEGSRTKLYAGILAVLLVALAVVLIFLGNSLGWWHLGGKTEATFALPDVSSQNVNQAEATLHRDGLKTKVRPDTSANTTANTQVVHSDPAAGSTVHKGQTVTLYTGNQGPPVTVQNFIGFSVQSAKSELVKLGLQADVTTSSTCTTQLIVCDQSPKSGTLPPGGTVNLVTAATTSAVPDVTGLDETTACNRLGQASFQCGTITKQASPSVPSGDVISTSPTPGTQEAPNAVVNLVVSSGPSQILVPDVVGDTEQAAVTALQPNLSAVVICQSTSDPTQDGLVQAQTPSGGMPAAPGSSVDITVASYPSCAATSTTTASSSTTTPVP
jgi:serine/threonine-protein kinase